VTFVPMLPIEGCLAVGGRSRWGCRERRWRNTVMPPLFPGMYFEQNHLWPDFYDYLIAEIKRGLMTL
jgi:hypothetical protein